MAELFVQGGRIAMTNLIFPASPYSTLRLYSEGGATQLHSAKLYPTGDYSFSYFLCRINKV